jgi:hypothetical protein
MQVKQIIMHKSKERIYGLKRKLLQSTVRWVWMNSIFITWFSFFVNVMFLNFKVINAFWVKFGPGRAIFITYLKPHFFLWVLSEPSWVKQTPIHQVYVYQIWVELQPLNGWNCIDYGLLASIYVDCALDVLRFYGLDPCCERCWWWCYYWLGGHELSWEVSPDSYTIPGGQSVLAAGDKKDTWIGFVLELSISTVL